MEKVRIDKWLWSVRLFKSRSLATEACRSGHIKIDEESVKPSYLLSRGEVVLVKKNGFNYRYKVVDLLDKRVGAAVAEPCYEDLTPEEELQKFNAWFAAQSKKFEFRERGEGRPTKKDRREIDRFKGDD